MISTKLTDDDLILIEALRELRVEERVLARECEIQKKNHLRVARNLSDQKIAEKFGVSRTHINRLFAAARD
jgi:AraC-like DNA-binding protein